MHGVHYEPLPRRIVYQQHTKEGDYVLYFVPADLLDNTDLPQFISSNEQLSSQQGTTSKLKSPT